MSNQVDSTWVEVDPKNELIPVRFKLPPNLEGKLYAFSPTRAIYVVGPGLTTAGVEATLQFGVDRVQSPDDFATGITEGGGTIENQVRDGMLSGRAATEAFGTLESPLPQASIMGDDGHLRDVAAQANQARYHAYYVPIDDHVFRVSYRIPDKELATWEPIFQAIIGTLIWK